MNPQKIKTDTLLNYDNFIEGCKKFPRFGKTKIELAAFLANMTQETFGGWDTAPGGPLAWGGCFGSEGTCTSGEPNPSMLGIACPDYNTPSCDGMNKAAGYYGRGPLQLTYCSNYKAAGDAIGLNIFNYPNILVTNGVAAFEASIWYWMNWNDASCCDAVKKKTCHDVITEKDPDFTKTIAIINGAVECKIKNEDTLGRTEFIRRNAAFRRICNILDIKTPPCGSTCNSWAAEGDACYGSYPAP